MSAGSWPNSACATGPSWSSPPTSPGSSPPAADRSTPAAYIPRCIPYAAVAHASASCRPMPNVGALPSVEPVHLTTSQGETVMSTIAVEALTKRYGTVTAVDDLTFRLAPGRITGFLGPNGAGKSTTIRVLLGLARPTCGLATINGRPYAELRDPLRQVGALLDPNVFHPGRSGRMALRIAARPARIPGQRVEEVLELTGLGGAAHRRAGGYSQGMRQRLPPAPPPPGGPAAPGPGQPAHRAHPPRRP